MEKRILIKEDLEQFKEIAKDLKQFMPVLNQLKESFESLEIGPFTNEVFKKINLLGSKYHVEIYIKNLENQLDKLGIKSSLMRENTIKDHEQIIENFKKAVDNAKNFYPQIFTSNRPKLTLKFISFENGLFVISKEDKEMILEDFCRLYLENEDEIKLYNISKKLEGAFNEYLEFFFETGISSINKHYSGSHVLKFDEDLNQMIVSPEGVKIVSNYKKKYEAYILERNDKNKKRIDTQQIKI